VIVRFNSVDEFLEELKKDRDDILDSILRVTQSRKDWLDSPSFPILSVIVTFALDMPRLPRVHPFVVRLDYYCGAIGGSEKQDALAKAREVQEKIEDACREMGIEVRGGVLEEAMS